MIRLASLFESFGDVGRDGHGRPSELGRQAVDFMFRKPGRRAINPEHHPMRLLPDRQLLKCFRLFHAFLLLWVDFLLSPVFCLLSSSQASASPPFHPQPARREFEVEVEMPKEIHAQKSPDGDVRRQGMGDHVNGPDGMPEDHKTTHRE